MSDSAIWWLVFLAMGCFSSFTHMIEPPERLHTRITYAIGLILLVIVSFGLLFRGDHFLLWGLAR
ncbi:MAG TPA: hypothetical protein VF183_02170 [Acidimicrobiales bacterium]